jgi:hypothetical protein
LRTHEAGTEYEADLGATWNPFAAALDWKVAPREARDGAIDTEIKITTPRRKFKMGRRV